MDTDDLLKRLKSLAADDPNLSFRRAWAMLPETRQFNKTVFVKLCRAFTNWKREEVKAGPRVIKLDPLEFDELMEKLKTLAAETPGAPFRKVWNRLPGANGFKAKTRLSACALFSEWRRTEGQKRLEAAILEAQGGGQTITALKDRHHLNGQQTAILSRHWNEAKEAAKTTVAEEVEKPMKPYSEEAKTAFAKNCGLSRSIFKKNFRLLKAAFPRCSDDDLACESDLLFLDALQAYFKRRPKIAMSTACYKLVRWKLCRILSIKDKTPRMFSFRVDDNGETINEPSYLDEFAEYPHYKLLDITLDAMERGAQRPSEKKLIPALRKTREFDLTKLAAETGLSLPGVEFAFENLKSVVANSEVGSLVGRELAG